MSKTADGKWIMCDGPKDCGERIKNGHWFKVKAEDWFMTKDGKHYCPAHHPKWVAAWRKNKK